MTEFTRESVTGGVAPTLRFFSSTKREAGGSGRAARAAAPIWRGSLDSYRSRYEKRLTVPAPAPMLTPSVVLLVSAPVMMVLIAPLGSWITAMPTVTTEPVFVPATPPVAVDRNDPVLKSNWYCQLSPPTEHEAPPVA